MNIVICDHKRSQGEALMKMIAEYQENRSGSCQLFCDYDILKAQILENLAGDVYLIDVECCDNGISINRGIELAECVYNCNPRAWVIFVSSHMQDYMEEIFLHNIHVGGLLNKPVKQEILQKLLLHIGKQYQEESAAFWTARYRNTIYNILVDDIIYLESDNHHVHVVTRKRNIDIYRRFNGIEEELPAHFIRCHRSYIVNMDYISVLGNNEITLTHQGIILPLGKNYKEMVRSAYLAYRR